MFEVGVSIRRVFERSRYSVHSVFLDEGTVNCLLAPMEARLKTKGSKEFVKSSRVGNKAFIVHW